MSPAVLFGRLIGPPSRRRPIASLVLALVVVGLIGYVFPDRPRNPLFETAAWTLLVLASFAGWGSLVRESIAPSRPVDLGLRLSWGAALVCFVGGVLMVPALMTRAMAFVLVDVGLVLAIVSVVRERGAIERVARFFVRSAKREPRLALVVAIVAFLVVVQCLSAIADWHTNPYDDDIAYLAFVKKLNDTGTVLEPFSFRRLSAYGGQTLFIQLVSIRAEASQANTFDRAVCATMVVLLIAGYRASKRRASLMFVLLTVVFFVTLPSIAINTGSYYSGVVFFLALHRTLVWLGDEPVAPLAAAVPLGLLSAAVCTLRQNYLPVPVVMLGASYGYRAFAERGSWPKRLAEPLATATVTAMALLPWMIVSWQSSRTFLYPVMSGTFNRALALDAAGMSFIREVWFYVWTALEGVSLKTFGLFVLGAALLREGSTRRPIWSFAVGAAAGFVLLVRGLTQSDAGNSARYIFGFLMAFAVAVALEASLVRWPAKAPRAQFAVGVVLFAILAQLVLSRDQLYKPYQLAFHNIEELAHQVPRGPRAQRFELGMYRRLQSAIPPGERFACLLDEPHYLDFSRNPIWNLDMPGYASPAPGMPFFHGADALEDYLRGLGIRYLTFVRSDASRYEYRREYWIQELASEQELWRAYSPYIVDFLDMLTELARRHRHLFDEAGVVVLDLSEKQ